MTLPPTGRKGPAKNCVIGTFPLRLDGRLRILQG
jgi:hypothetical protein